jgi:hypothetical protein
MSMNTQAVAAAPAPGATPLAVPASPSLLRRADQVLEDAGRWILIALYIFGLVFPLVGAALAWLYA